VDEKEPAGGLQSTGRMVHLLKRMFHQDATVQKASYDIPFRDINRLTGFEAAI